uniref:Uncharacterized protein n=1 Tax=Monopterus albus TaxID=43700 RepID=A0A3Q3K4Y3_MONAL
MILIYTLFVPLGKFVLGILLQLHTYIHSSISSISRNWHSNETIKQYMKHYGLGDIWRIINPTSREYTYFSSLHQSFFSNRPFSYQ